ncbi:hypothetical protein M3T53_07045 [Actinomyces sp. B33]|uniref:hypothetical protein n=1 Tax=Actinomyces sp. B33 TaxID=2942131 RepID=UPI0023401AE9|nr:hypothetical protein [Actinomyces sp. B33]MDC4233463.1 hypothetical protein [Actinomyces sp. B33]
MSEPNRTPIRHVDLVFEDEAPTARPESASARFSQRATGPRPASRTGREGSARRSNRAREGSRPQGGFGSRSADRAARAEGVGVRMPEGRLPSKLVIGALVATGVGGILVANLAGAASRAAITVPAVLTSSAAVAGAASIASTLLGGLGALIVAGAWVSLRRRGRREDASGLIVSMTVAWAVFQGLMLLGAGSAPVAVPAVGFLAALSTAGAAILGRGRGIIGSPAALVVSAGTAALLAVSALLVPAGLASLVGVAVSTVVGAGGALLGVRAWNRFWAPIVEHRARAASALNAMFADRRYATR